MQTIEFELPIYYEVVRKTKKNSKHLVGANWFRNIQYHLKNKVKQEYHKLVADAVKNQEPINGKFCTRYIYYYKSKVSDATNVISQVEKFALDGLIEAGKIEEDSVLFHVRSGGWHCEEDKENPRLKIIVSKFDVQ